jgi:hypothetical protein
VRGCVARPFPPGLVARSPRGGGVIPGCHPSHPSGGGEVEWKHIEPMDHWHLGYIFRGPLTGVTIGYFPARRSPGTVMRTQLTLLTCVIT